MYAARMIYYEEDESTSTYIKEERNGNHSGKGNRVFHMVRTGILLSDEASSSTNHGKDF